LSADTTNANGARFAIVVARFNEQFTEALLDGCCRAFAEQRVDEARYDIARVPGAVELPIACQRFAESGRYAAVIALGAVIRGDTSHYDYVCQMVSSGCLRVALDTRIPVIFGVLTTDNFGQTAERCGRDNNNKGYESALAALEMAAVLPKIDEAT